MYRQLSKLILKLPNFSYFAFDLSTLFTPIWVSVNLLNDYVIGDSDSLYGCESYSISSPISDSSLLSKNLPKTTNDDPLGHGLDRNDPFYLT